FDPQALHPVLAGDFAGGLRPVGVGPDLPGPPGEVLLGAAGRGNYAHLELAAGTEFDGILAADYAHVLRTGRHPPTRQVVDGWVLGPVREPDAGQEGVELLLDGGQLVGLAGHFEEPLWVVGREHRPEDAVRPAGLVFRGGAGLPVRPDVGRFGHPVRLDL